MKKNTKIWLIRAGLLLMPLLAIAQTSVPTDIPILPKLEAAVKAIISIIFVLVTMYFLWGVVQYIMAGGDEKKIEQGRSHMLWGIVGMAVMVSSWYIVTAVVNYFVKGQGTGSGEIPGGVGI